MIPAEKARKISASNAINQEDDELRPIEKAIYESIEKGHRSLEWRKWIGFEQVSLLECLGYSVNAKHALNTSGEAYAPYYIIEW